MFINIQGFFYIITRIIYKNYSDTVLIFGYYQKEYISVNSPKSFSIYISVI